MPHSPTRAGVEEATERDHRQRRREQDVQQVHAQQLGEVARAREDADRAEQHDEVDERHDADRRSEAEVEDAPEQGDRQDQHRDQDEQRLAGAGVLVVARIGADQRQPGAHAIGDGPGARTGSTPATLLGGPSGPDCRWLQRRHPMRIQARRSGRCGVHVPFGPPALGRRRGHPSGGALRPGGADGGGDVRRARGVRRRSARRRPAARRRGVRRPAHRRAPGASSCGSPSARAASRSS